MDLGLAGKIAVVSGASKGIGLAVTQALVAEGAQVAAGARSPGALAGLEGVHPVAVDLVVLLAGSRGANVTGSDILIDGGLVQTL